jgi:hypothetical protein
MPPGRACWSAGRRVSPGSVRFPGSASFAGAGTVDACRSRGRSRTTVGRPADRVRARRRRVVRCFGRHYACRARPVACAIAHRDERDGAHHSGDRRAWRAAPPGCARGRWGRRRRSRLDLVALTTWSPEYRTAHASLLAARRQAVSLLPRAWFAGLEQLIASLEANRDQLGLDGLRDGVPPLTAVMMASRFFIQYYGVELAFGCRTILAWTTTRR